MFVPETDCTLREKQHIRISLSYSPRLAAGDESWQTYSPQEDPFTISFPGQPVLEDSATPVGTTAHSASFKTEAGVVYAVVHGESGLKRPKLYVEPGRSLIASAGTTLYRIGVRKRLPDGAVGLIVDGGMSDNPRPALYEARYAVSIVGRPLAPPDGSYMVFGRHCETDRLFPDVALIHVHRADVFGNAQIEGYPHMDADIASAATTVILSTEQIVDTEEIRRTRGATDIPFFAVDAVVEAPSGSFPHECYGLYDADINHIGAYAERVSVIGQPKRRWLDVFARRRLRKRSAYPAQRTKRDDCGDQSENGSDSLHQYSIG